MVHNPSTFGGYKGGHSQLQACYYGIHSFSQIQSTASQTISLIPILNIL